MHSRNHRWLVVLKALLPALLCCALAEVAAQAYVTHDTASKRAQKLYEQAVEYRRSRAPVEALDALTKAIETEPGFIDAHRMKAELLYDINQVEGAIASMESVVQLDSMYDPRNVYFLYRLYDKMGNHKASSACLHWYLEHGDIAEEERSELQDAMETMDFRDSLMAHPVQYDPVPVSGDVNTEDIESLPAFTVDGRQMVFTRRYANQEDLYAATWDPESKQWVNARPLQNVNTQFDEGAASISADGKVLAFTSCGRRDAVGSCDIYVTLVQADGTWSQVRNIAEINTRKWDGHPTLTADGMGMFFSSDRGGGHGGRDIWYTRRTRNDHWTEPVNIGPAVNTKGNEAGPFLHFDDRTLYFMSDGHRGMGHYDIFITRRTAQGWQEPVNLGYPINTPLKEGTLCIHPDGIRAFYTGNQLTRGRYHADIFTFELDPSLRPAPVSYLEGLVVDASTGAPVISNVEVFNLEDTTELYNYRSNTEGAFKTALAHGAAYGLHVTAPGYAFHSEQFSLDVAEPFSAHRMTIALQPLQAGGEEMAGDTATPIVLNNIQFETGKATIRPSSRRELDALKQLMHENPLMSIEIRGHTDDVGTPEDNMTLSQDRAKAVFDWLVDNGIDAGRLRHVGFGETRPIASNATGEGRALNRRTEFVMW